MPLYPAKNALVYDIADFGAISGQDVTNAILAALSAASSGEAEVYAPGGTWIYSSDLPVSNNITVRGAGRSTIFKTASGSTANGFKASGVAHVVFKDFQMDGNSANVTYAGQYNVLHGGTGITYDHLQPIYILNSDDVTVENCYIHDTFSSGIMAQGSTNLIFRGNRLKACGDNQIYVRAVDASPYTPCQNVTIANNVCNSGGFSGIQVLGSSYIAITGNVCSNNGGLVGSSGQGDGIGSEGASHVVISGNVCFNNGIQGIEIRETEEIGVPHAKSSHIVISGNECYGNTSSNGDAGGISISDADDIEVSGNIVYGNYYGININGGANAGMGVTNIHLSANQVRGNTQTNIRIAPESNYYDHLVLNDQLGKPIRYYKLEEASGTTATDSGTQATNGTYSGTGVSYQSTKLITDSSSTYSVALNGSSGNVTVPTTNLPSGSAQWTIEAWYQVASAPSDYTAVMGFGTYGSAHEMAILYIMNNLSATLSTYSGDIGSNSNLCPVGKPHYLVGSFDGTNINLYIDGVLQNHTAEVPNIVLAFANIGSQQSSAWLNGNVTRAAWYNYALSAAQVAARYNAGKYLFNITLSDNMVSDANSSDNVVATTQIHVSGGAIRNSGSGHQGLSLQTGANGTSIVDVDFLNNGDNGIYISGGVSNAFIRSCLFDNPGTPTQTRAVYEDGTSGPTTIEGCVIRNMVTADYQLQNSGSVAKQNDTLTLKDVNSGSATITSGTTSITVNHGLWKTPTRVYLAPTTDTLGARYWISSKTSTQFTIILNASQASNITFDWRAWSWDS